MLPALRQRLMIAGVAIVGGLVWWLAAGALGAANASSGISLFDARIGVLPALGLLLLAGLPAIALSLAVSSTGHPLAGVFTSATGLIFVAGAGGAMDGYLRRHAMPAGYGWLLAELVLWAVLWIGLLALIRWLRPGMRDRLGLLATDHHLGEDVEIRVPDGNGLIAGGVCLSVAALFCWLLLQSEATGQVIGALILSFVIGALVAQLAVPTDNPVAILLSPLALGAVAYGYVLLSPALSGEEAVLRAWYQRTLWGPVLVLPIFYASAGVCGCAMGIGMAQAIHRARVHAAEGGS